MGISISGDHSLMLDEDTSLPSRSGSMHFAALPDDGWIFTWIDRSRNLVTERFSADGSQTGDTVTLAEGLKWQETSVDEPQPREDGSWLQAYSWREEVDGEWYFYFTVDAFDANGEKLFSNTRPSDFNHTLKLLDDGSFLVVSQTQDNHIYHATADLFDDSGRIIATIDLGTRDVYNYLKITSFADGSWSLSLASENGDETYFLYDSNGTLIHSIAAPENGSVAFLDDGSYKIDFAITDYGTSTTTKYTEYYDSDGALIKTANQSEIQFERFYVEQITELSDGRQLLLWWDEQDSGQSVVNLRLLDANGALIIDYGTVGDANAGDGSVLELSDGRWIAFFGGMMQVFGTDGAALGDAVAQFPSALAVQATDDGGWSVLYNSALSVFDKPKLRTLTFHTNDLDNAPYALNSTGFVTEDKPSNDFNFRAYDADGDEITSIIIETLPAMGQLTYRGETVEIGQTIDIEDVDGVSVVEDLVWTPPENLSGDNADFFLFRALDENGNVSENLGRLTLDISEVNDAPWGADATNTILEDEAFKLKATDFPYFDIENDPFYGVKLNHADANGILRTDNQRVWGWRLARFDNILYTPDENESGKNYTTINFSVRDDNSLSADNNNEKGFHTLTINVLPVNDAPKGEDFVGWTQAGKSRHLSDYEFSIEDVEGDRLKSIVIDDLPDTGTLRLHGKTVHSGDEIKVSAINDLTYKVDKRDVSDDGADFTYFLRDNGGTKNGGDDLSNHAYSYHFRAPRNVNVLQGTDRNDTLAGTDGRDVVEGGRGNDRLKGLGGDDTLIGGPGSDIFIMNEKTDDDIVQDFEAGRDRIDLRNTPLDNLSDVLKHAWHGKGVVHLEWTYRDKGHLQYDTVAVYGIEKDDLSAGDFIF